MARCARCAADVPSTQRFCGSCGSPVVPSSEIGTVAMPEVAVAVSRTSSPDDGRFPPGITLAQRYRIAGRLGQGGMGEVYKAFDLTLGQNVALKFLPERITAGGAILERFRNEVRLARQVSDPNVCRVYDIGEIEGATFLSMEYVDGEDLASLLRRIGRLPSDKALDIARRLCAGLSAAHDKGVLHRDFKPANIMIDGRGEVLITDFGLAAPSGNIQVTEVRQGTPAYMSPEQLAGTEVTVKSDIYALGLVLYEIFTGKRAFEARSADELMRMQRESTPASLTTVAKEVDPAVERVIHRCLAPDPRNRPASAKAVALALPGGDPLAAAVAAGETPSPEMVANSGETGGVHPGLGIGIVALVIASLVLLAGGQQFFHTSPQILDQTPFPNSPEGLAAIAHEHARNLGYTVQPADSAYGLEYNEGWLKYLRDHYPAADRPAKLASSRPATITFWYRQSPRPMDPGHLTQVSMSLPPFDVSGMIRMRLDGQGRLLAFEAMPLELKRDKESRTAPDWAPLFVAAGLDTAKFVPADPQWTPLTSSDAQMAWTGAWPDAPEIPIRIEAAAWRGMPVSFRVIEPWTVATRDILEPTRGGGIIPAVVLFFVLFPAGALLARRNLRLKRGDPVGGRRVAFTIFSAGLAGQFLHGVYSSGIDEMGHLVTEIGVSMFLAVVGYVLYVGLEPYVRRRWPQALVSLARLLEGRFRDPLVGTHVLAGAAGAVFFMWSSWIMAVLQSRKGEPNRDALDILMGPRHFLDSLTGSLSVGLPAVLGLLLLFFLLRSLLRRDWLASVAFILLLTVRGGLQSGPAFGILVGLSFGVAALFLLLRFGVLAFYTAGTMMTLFAAPLTLDTSRWFFGYSLATIVIIVAIAVYGCWAALGGRPIWKDELT